MKLLKFFKDFFYLALVALINIYKLLGQSLHNKTLIFLKRRLKKNWLNSLCPTTLHTNPQHLQALHNRTHVACQAPNFQSMEHPSVHPNSFIVASHVVLVVFFIFILHGNTEPSTKAFSPQLIEDKLLIWMH